MKGGNKGGLGVTQGQSVMEGHGQVVWWVVVTVHQYHILNTIVAKLPKLLKTKQ